jgi:hypothetical protein
VHESALVDGVAFLFVHARVFEQRIVVFIADHALVIVLVLVIGSFVPSFLNLSNPLPLLVAVIARGASEVCSDLSVAVATTQKLSYAYKV